MACKGTTTVAVRVSIPDTAGVDTPARDVALLALPYDRDSVIAAMEARAPLPRPSTATVDSAFAGFRAPFAAFAAAAGRVRRLEDSVRSLRAHADSAAPADRAATAAALLTAEATLTAAQREREARRADLDRARAQLAAADTARARIRDWLDAAYAGYDTITKPLVRFRAPLPDTTDAVGRAEFVLPSGHWWVTARAWDANDPNSDWYWNVKVTGDSVVLSRANAQRRPRY